jgi:hypothetical protein
MLTYKLTIQPFTTAAKNVLAAEHLYVSQRDVKVHRCTMSEASQSRNRWLDAINIALRTLRLTAQNAAGIPTNFGVVGLLSN